MQQKHLINLWVLLLFVSYQYTVAQTSNLWITLHPNSGTTYQIDEDITINNGYSIENYSSPHINCTQSRANNNLVYSVTYNGSDLDKDGNNDLITFDLLVKGYIDATYNYSPNKNTSSVTNYGTQSDVTLINNYWGVFGDDDVDAGQSLVYQIENLVINGLSSDFTYTSKYTNANFIETNGGRDHTLIFGFGENLTSLEIDSNQSISLNTTNTFSVTGAGSFYTGVREWAINSLTFNIEIKGPNTTWDVTDYSSFEQGPTLYHNYPSAIIAKTTLPSFSWNKIPRWVAVRNAEAFSDEQIIDIANNFQLVMLEKANQQGFEYIEDGIENAATRIKALKPDLTTLFYYNTYINYKGYKANIEYEANAANWSTYQTNEETGEEEIYMFKDLYYWYNQDIENMRNWWINTCINMANLNVIDGIFVDKIVNPDINGDVFDENGVPVNNYVKMLNDLYNQLPANKLLVGNTLRNERAGASRPLMQIMDGSYMERWQFQNTDQTEAEAIAVSIQLMREALQKGKMINLQSGPQFSTDEEIPSNEADRIEFAKEYVHFPLAIFLIIAKENAYFSYNLGVNALNTSSDIWDTSFIDEFYYHLGEPLGAPTKNGYIYERSFENLDLWVNLETKETVFNWHDTSPLPRPSAVLDQGNIWYHNYQSDEFNAEINATILGTLELNQPTVSYIGNSSPLISKFTKQSGTNSYIKFNLPHNIETPSEAVFKVRVYTEANSTNTNNNLRLILRKDGSTNNQLSKTIDITETESWIEYTFDFSNTLFKKDYYNQINLFFASPDTDNDANGNVYYLDAIQGPESEILSTNNINVNRLILIKNKSADILTLSKNVREAKIFNFLGQLLIQVANTNTINISSFSESAYLLQVTLENGKTESIRFIKN